MPVMCDRELGGFGLRAASTGTGVDMADTKSTTDHDEIRQWVEERGGRPARVTATAGGDDAGILRIDFGEPDEGLSEIGWKEWFETFDESGLALLFQDGPDNRFNKLVSR